MTTPTPAADDALVAELKRLCEAAEPGPWKWTAGEGGPQLEGNIYASEMNPVLVCRGCGNKETTTEGVKGCMPEKLGDPLRACPLHPTKSVRDFIAACNPGVLWLVARIEQQQAEIDALRGVPMEWKP